MCRTFEVDGRLLGRSGIGRYIQEIVNICPFKARGYLRVSRAAYPSHGWHVVFDQSKLYSLIEQVSRLWAKVDLRWTPHYNYPVLADGLQIVTIHDLAHLALPHIFGRGLKRFYAFFYFNLVLLRADHVIFISEFTRCEFLRIVGDLPRSHGVILNGVGDEWFFNSSMTKVARGGEISILAVGNIKPHKNLKNLVSAVINLSQKYDIVLRVVGSRDGFIVSDTDFPNAACVEWLGYISDEDLRGEYARADCFLMPSIYEGFGLPILEAMAAGCPVAASNIPAFIEVTKGQAIELFSPHNVTDIEDAIVRVIELPPTLRERRINEARELAKSYSWVSCAAKTWSALEALEREALGVVV
jgi:glycosyltransferase involved in cell wall biosynthesis